MIIIAPWSKALRNGGNNPKNYPYWKELVNLLPKPIVQVGTPNEEQLVDDMRVNLSLDNLKTLILECKTWISVDTFFQHFAWKVGKKGIVLWGPSDPVIYGHPENINLLLDRKHLVENQFIMWEQQTYDPERFVKPQVVVDNLKKLL
jgi:ADP-heptose:LPS heptosyltransferase